MNKTIGVTIISYCRKNHVALKDIAVKLGYNRSSLYRLLRKPDMSVSTLQAISQTLGHNFFQYLYHDQNTLPPEEINKLRRDNAKMQLTIDRITNEINLLTLSNEFLSKQLNLITQSNYKL